MSEPSPPTSTPPPEPQVLREPERAMRSFGHILVNTAVANLTTSYLWFALVFWVYLETRNVMATVHWRRIHAADCRVLHGLWHDR